MDFKPIEINLSGIGSIDHDKRVHKPKKIVGIKTRAIRYDNAEKMAKEIKIGKNDRYFTFISGNFIFGDFIEAFCVQQNYYIKKMTISTLSMSEENVASLENLLIEKYVNKLNLIVSDYFFANERHKIIKSIYDKLDIDNRFQLAVARSHTKICIFETYCGMKIVIHGSANLRSSDNIEQFDIEENADLFDYIDEFHDKIIEAYKTINKKVGGKKLWHQVDQAQEAKEGQQSHEEDQDSDQLQEDQELKTHRFKNPTF